MENLIFFLTILSVNDKMFKMNKLFARSEELKKDIKSYGKMFRIGMITRKEMIDALRMKYGYKKLK